jgi:hypothetical protein
LLVLHWPQNEGTSNKLLTAIGGKANNLRFSVLGWIVYFLLKIDLEFLFRKIGASLNFKTELVSLHISAGASNFY